MGTTFGFSLFSIGIPISSRKQTLSAIKQSSSKCLEHSCESLDGPSKLLHCHLTVLTHLLCKASSLGNLWKLYPVPLTVSQPATMEHLGMFSNLELLISLLWLDILRLGLSNSENFTIMIVKIVEFMIMNTEDLLKISIHIYQN